MKELHGVLKRLLKVIHCLSSLISWFAKNLFFELKNKDYIGKFKVNDGVIINLQNELRRCAELIINCLFREL